MLPGLSPRRQQLQDLARLLTGLGLVLQQTAAYEARCASHAARLLYRENQHALSSIRTRWHAPPASASSTAESSSGNGGTASSSSSSAPFDPYDSAASSSSSASQPHVVGPAVTAPTAASVTQLLSGLQSAVGGASSALLSSASPLLSPVLSSVSLPQAASSVLAAVLPPGLPQPSPQQINAGAEAVKQAAQAWMRQMGHSATQPQQQQQHAPSYSPYSAASPSSSSSLSSSSASGPPFSSPHSSSPSSPERFGLPNLGSLTPLLPNLSALPEQLAAAGDTAAQLAARTLGRINSAVTALSPAASSFAAAAAAGQTPPRTERSQPTTAGPASSTPFASPSLHQSSALQQPPPPQSLPAAPTSRDGGSRSSPSSFSSASACSPAAAAKPSSSLSASVSASSPFPSPSAALSSLNSAAQAASSRLQQTSSSLQQTAQAFLPPLPRFSPRERAVPSTPLGRMFGFGGIAVRMVTGSVLDAAKRLLAGTAGEADGAAATAAAGGTERQDGQLKTRGQQEEGLAPETSIASTLTSSSAQPLHSGAASESTSPTAAADRSASASPTSSTPSSAASASSSAAAAPSGLSRFMSPANTERLAAGLCRMRGAALKVGQMLSIQDESLLPPQLQQVLNRVRDSADVMPRAQLERTLRAELGEGWESKFSSFDWAPIAAASIGQVHRGVEAESGRAVVLKVQYPGVADSISSDVNNVRLLIRLFNVLPPGLYVDQTMQAAKDELSVECDYRSEADSQTAFQQLIRSSPLHPRVNVPSVVPSLSTSRVLTSEWVPGVPIDHCARDGREALSAERRNELCLRLLHLCLLEVFDFRFMQTDPNWSNFLFDAERDVLHCIDFGASREYDKQFVDEYMRMVAACADRERDALIASSVKLGFLTGQESRQMLDAHVAAGFIVGEPFSRQYAAGYDFARMDMGRRVSELARIMLRLRLTPPPKDSYTLHRKLSGCFLTCRRLEAVIPCRDMFLQIFQNYRFGPEEEEDSSAHKQPQQPEYGSDDQPLTAALHSA